ncbi:KICSTOR complex protein szt2 [Physocladia obscura]|uniref:KICSTOR complex protein szt2 n=1 Tax=Physocladia obscura TaxID=109957 RepID=A0AAD5T2M2_9FUNG|nr:KICSTOR complex protein szt2 [Physocladia obscura]
MKVKEVKAIALLWRNDQPNASLATRADKEGWILRNMLRPLTASQLLNDSLFQLLDISTDSSKFSWDTSGLLREEEELRRNYHNSHGKQFQSMSRSSIQNNTISATTPTTDAGIELFRITPETHIFTFSTKNRVSIVVDVSASMRVVDSGTGGLNRVLIPLCFETLCNCLDGMTRKYSIKNSLNGSVLEMIPEIYVTVIAKAGASMAFGPDISPRAHEYITKHPIHVLLQDVQVTTVNLFSVSEKLYKSLNEYENEMISLRHMDDKNNNVNNSNNNYSSNNNSNNSTTNGNSNELAQLNTLEYGLLSLRLLPKDSSPVLIVLTDGVSMSLVKGEFIYRDVCRRLAKEIVNVTIIQVGSNGGFYPEVNFGYVPDNEALRFLTFACFGKFIYASDCDYLESPQQPPTSLSVETKTKTPEQKLLFQGPNFYHQNILIREVVVQKQKSPIGNNLVLQKYVVGSERPVDTPRIHLINSNSHSQSLQSQPPPTPTPARTAATSKSGAAKTATKAGDALSDAGAGGNDNGSSSSSSNNGVSDGESMLFETIFPWHPDSLPPYVGQLLFGYRDYTVEFADLSNLIKGRLLEGFSLKSVHVAGLSSNSNNANGGGSVSRKAGGGNHRTASSVSSISSTSGSSLQLSKVEIVLMRPWLPNVTIQYTIRAKFCFEGENFGKPFLSCVMDSKPRIELNLLADHAFACGFMNIENMDEKNDKMVKLHNYLGGIYEFDSLMKYFVGFKASLQKLPRADQRLFQPSSESNIWNKAISNGGTTLNDQGSIWNVMSQFMISKPASFKDWDRDVILRSSNPNRALTDISYSHSSSVIFGLRNVGGNGRFSSQAPDGSTGRSRLPSALILMIQSLGNPWSSFIINRTTFGRFYPDNEGSTASGFAILRIVYETDWLVSLRMLFFNVPVEGRHKMGAHLCRILESLSVGGTTSALSSLSSASSHNLGGKLDSLPSLSSYAPIKICAKPIRRMIIKYQFFGNDDSTLNETAVFSRSGNNDGLAFDLQYESIVQSLPLTEIHIKAQKSAINAVLVSPIPPRSYLRTFRWIWFADVNLPENVPLASSSSYGMGLSSKSENSAPNLSLLDLAMYLLYFQRLEDGYLLVSHLPDSVTMYREVTIVKPVQLYDEAGSPVGGLGSDSGEGRLRERQIVCGFQYVILIDKVQKTVVTELWFEPVSEGSDNPLLDFRTTTDVRVLFAEMGESVAREISEADFRLFQSLYTFDRIQHLGKIGSKLGSVSTKDSLHKFGFDSPVVGVEIPTSSGDKRIVSEISQPGQRVIVMRTGYNVESVLNKADFFCAIYSAPTVTGSSVEMVDILQIALFSPPFGSKSEGDLAFTSAATSPLMSGSISQDFINPRRTSQIPPLSSRTFSTPARPVTAAGVNWDILKECTNAMRIRVLLYKFFQDAMEMVTDGEVVFKFDQPRKSSMTGSKMDASIVSANGLIATDQSLLARIREVFAEELNFDVFTAGFNESLCFVKIRSADLFILTFIPNSNPTVESCRDTYFTVTTVQCNRLRVHSSSSGRSRLASKGFSQFVPGISEHGFNWTLQVEKEYFAANESRIIADGTIILKGDTKSPVLKDDEDKQQAADSMEYGKQFLNSVTNAFSVAHCKSVYAALLQNVDVSARDLEKAFSACVEISVDIDLTNYLNALTLRHRKMNPRDVRHEKNHILKSIHSVLSKHFKQMVKFEGHENVYFFTPDDDEELSPSRINCAQTPLFIRTECNFKKNGLSQPEMMKMPVVAFPTSYVISDLSSWDVDENHTDSVNIDFTPREIGTDENPLQNSDGTVATLRVVCLCLIKPSKFDALSDETNENYKRPLDDKRLILRSEKEEEIDKVDTLYETIEKIKIILDDEIINTLLDLPSNANNQKFSMGFIRNCLSNRHQSPSVLNTEVDLSSYDFGSSSVFDIPINCIKTISNNELLVAEFAKVRFKTQSIMLSQIKDLFCIQANGDWTELMQNENENEKNVVTEDSKIVIDNFQTQNWFSVEKGLGIGFVAPDIISSALYLQLSRKNWMCISFTNTYSRIWYFSRFSSLHEQIEMQDWIRNKIRIICDRVSKILLLRELKENHRASRLLIEKQLQDLSSDDEDEGEDNSGSLSTFKPNQFACESIFSKSFPIHWRVKPIVALNAAVSSLTILAITNRTNMFVFEAENSIVYFKLSIQEVESESDMPRASSIEEIANFDTINRESPKQESPSMIRHRTPPILTNSHKDHFILLEFFGVDTPSPKIMAEFVTMIESKLTMLTQKEISIHMSRNTGTEKSTIKLTPMDVDFILPTNDVASYLSKYYSNTYGIHSLNVNLERSNSREVNFGDFAFFYNSSLSRDSSRFESSIGAGTAVICLSVLDYNRRIISRMPSPSTQDSNVLNIITNYDMYQNLRNDREKIRISSYDTCIHSECPFFLAVHIWYHGALSGEGLMDFVSKCFVDTVMDFLVESSASFCIKALEASIDWPQSSSHLDLSSSFPDNTLPSQIIDPLFGSFFDQMLAHLKLAAEFKNSVVEELSSPIKLTLSIMDGLAMETRDLLRETSPLLKPVLVSRQKHTDGSSDIFLHVPHAINDSRVESNQHEILVVAGIRELYDFYGISSSSTENINSPGILTPLAKSMDSSIDSNSDFGRLSKRGSGQFVSSYDFRRQMENFLSYGYNTIENGCRNGFFMMLIRLDSISVATYNIKKSLCDDLFNHILRILSWNNIRMQFLENSFNLGNSVSPVTTKPTAVDFPSSYAGVGGLGHDAMKHFEKRVDSDEFSKSCKVDDLCQQYNINSSALQKNAVAILDIYVRNIGLEDESLVTSEKDTAGLSPNGANFFGSTSVISKSISRGGLGIFQPQTRHTESMQKEKLSTQDLAAVLRSVRFHFVHYPIFFSELGNRASVGDSVDKNQRIQVWFREILKKYSSEYIKYLSSLDFELLKTENEVQTKENWISSVKFFISNNLNVELEPVYLIKKVSGGTFLLQIGVDGFCVAVNLYTIKHLSMHMNPFEQGMRYGAENESEKQFRHENDICKKSLHNILENQQNAVVNILDAMKTFEKYNSNRFVYARSRMLSGECETDSQNLTDALFKYIVKNPRLYGFKSVIYEDLPIACFITSAFPDFAKDARNSKFEKGPFCFTVVVYMSEEGVNGHNQTSATEDNKDNKDVAMKLRYYLLILDRENLFPLQGVETKSSSFVNQSYSDKLKEYLYGVCYLGDIAKYAEKKIKALVEQAVKYYNRDSLWKDLHLNKHPTLCGTNSSNRLRPNSDGAYEWTKMFLEKISGTSRSFLEIDPQFLNLFGDSQLPWFEIISFLRTRFSNHVRQICEEPKFGRNHLLFFNPKNRDYLIHFIYWKVNESGLPQSREEDNVGVQNEGASSGTVQLESRSTEKKMDEDDKIILKELKKLEGFGAKMAKPGEYQVDIMLVSREGISDADEVEYQHCNELVNAICFWLWQNK